MHSSTGGQEASTTVCDGSGADVKQLESSVYTVEREREASKLFRHHS